jgi:4-amino-4-deoxy-L-arabinose transferase-like glycosyltransferase
MSTTEDFRRIRPQRARPRFGGWPLLLILILAVGLRVMAWRNAVQMTNDGVDFLWQAQRFLDGDFLVGLGHPYHPGFALLTALVARMTGDILTAALAVSIAAGALVVVAVHALARLALPNRPDVAWGAALLAALHERTLIVTSDITSDGLFLALFLLSLATIVAAEQSGRFPLRMVGAGALAGLAYLTRPEGLFLAGVAVLWLLLGVMRRTGRRGRPLARPTLYLAGLGAFLASLLVVACPYVWVMHDITGEWGLSLKPSITATGLGDASGWSAAAGAPIASPRIGVDEDTDDIVGSPSTAVPDSIETIRRLRKGLVQSVVELLRAMRADVVVLALLGVPIFMRRRSGLLAVMLALMAAWVAVGTTQWVLSGYLARRHMLAPALLALPVAGAGLVWLWGARRTPGPLRLLGRVLVLLVLVAAGASGARLRHTNHAPRVEALQWTAAHTAPDERIGVHRRKDGYDAGRETLLVSLPCQEADLLDAMDEWNVRLLVMDLDQVAHTAPHWLDGALFEERTRFGTGKDTVIVLERASAGG